MRRVVPLLCLSLIVASVATAGEIIQNINFSPINISISQEKGYDVVKYDYYPGYDEIVGNPSLPELPLYIVIPPTATVTGVEVLQVDEEVLAGRYLVMPAQNSMPFSVSAEEPPFVPPNAAVYGAKAIWPRDIVDYRFTGSKSGFRIGVFRMYPVRYLPTEQKLVLCTGLRLKITYQEGSVAPLRRTEHQNALHASDLMTLVENTDDIARFAPPLRITGVSGSRFLPPGNYENVILTPTIYKDTFQVLADWRTKQGIPTRVVCIESTASYPGKDVAERMRQFLQDADTTWGLNFAFIARQDLHTPLQNREYRKCWVTYSSYRDSLPCDLYYSDLWRGVPPQHNVYYDWNGNKNTKYGEVNDTIDYFSDIYVGMVTLDDAGQASHFMRKLLLQESKPDTNYFAKGLLVNGVTFSDSYLNNIYNAMTRPPWIGDKMYQSGAGHEKPSATKFKDSVNAGWGYTAVISHGTINSINIPDAYTASMVNQQTNTNKLNTVIAVCCYPGAYDQADECLAETMAVATKGFVNVMMNSRYGWVNVAEYYNELFFYKFMPMKTGTQCSAYVYVGQALARVKDHLVYRYPKPGQSENRWKWETFEKNLFGDPSNALPNWSPVRTMTVNHASQISTGPQNFTVTVGIDKFAPVEDALVCVWKGTEVYDYGLTNASGQITFSINPTTPGTMSVTATERNCLRYEGTVTVIQSGVTEPKVEPKVPIYFALGRNRPNPFGYRTAIEYQLPRAIHVRLLIFDTNGRLVRTLVDRQKNAGYYRATWDGKNDVGHECASGVYFYRIEAGDFSATKNLVITH